MQSPDNLHHILLPGHHFINILIGKSALLRHIILFPLSKDNALLFQILYDLLRCKYFLRRRSGMSSSNAVG